MIAPRDFSLATGELTPTMKLKRHTVLELYAKKIDQVSQEERIFFGGQECAESVFIEIGALDKKHLFLTNVLRSELLLTLFLSISTNAIHEELKCLLDFCKKTSSFWKRLCF
jgi:hypothetical protein